MRDESKSLEQPAHRSIDAHLDARSIGDVGYLAELGYKQELNRAIGLISSFGLQFALIAIWASLFGSIVIGLSFFGPASFWTYLIGGFFQVATVGMAVATLVSAYPLAGGGYQIVNRILLQSPRRALRKPWVGWQAGWWVVVAHVVSIVSGAWAAVPFVAGWLGYELTTPKEYFPWVVGAIIITTVINVVGIRVAAWFSNSGVALEILGCAVVFVALLAIEHNTQPISILTNTGGTTMHGPWIAAALFSFLMPAYFISGFDATGNASEETRNAARNAPLGSIIANFGGWIVGGVLFYLVLRAIPDVNDVMASNEPTKLILESAVGRQITAVVEACAVVALLGNIVVMQTTGARILWSQARDGQFPAAEGLRQTRHQTPVNAVLFVAFLALVVAVIGRQSTTGLVMLGAFAALAWALAYGVVVAVGLYGHLSGQLPKRPIHFGKFTLPIFVLGVIWSVVLCVVLVWQNPSQVGGGMAGAIVLGIIVYLLIPKERRGSHMANVLEDRALNPTSGGDDSATPMAEPGI